MNKEILLIIDTVSNEKNVDREIIIDAMEHALASAVKKKYKLDNDMYFLVGFSQGTMLAIYTSLREKLLGVVGYSGAFLGNLPNEEIKNNDYLLLHGQNDTIVPIAKMHNAVEQLEPVAKTLIKKIYNDLEHSINEEGIIEGLNFIQERK